MSNDISEQCGGRKADKGLLLDQFHRELIARLESMAESGTDITEQTRLGDGVIAVTVRRGKRKYRKVFFCSILRTAIGALREDKTLTRTGGITEFCFRSKKFDILEFVRIFISATLTSLEWEVEPKPISIGSDLAAAA